MYNIAAFPSFIWCSKWQGFIFLALFWCALVIACHLWNSSRNAEKSFPYPPAVKVPFYSFYRHVRTVPSYSAMKKMSLHVNAFILNAGAGHSLIFQKESLFGIEVFHKRYVALVKSEAAEQLLSSNAMLEKAGTYRFLHPWLRTGLLTSHGSKWRSRRKLLTHSFHFDILKDFLPVFDEQAKILVRILDERRINEEWIDIFHPLSLCSLDIICETILGARVGAQANGESKYVAAVLRCSKNIIRQFYNPAYHLDIIFRFSKLGREVTKDVECIHNFTRKVIQERKTALKSEKNGYHAKDREHFPDRSKTKRKALLDLLIDLQLNNEDFTDDDIGEEVDTFSLGGQDTTVAAMSWAIYLIGLQPDVQNKIHVELDGIYGNDQGRPTTVEDLKEMQYLECALKETLRLFPSVPFYGRKVTEDIIVCGYKIRKGIEIGVVPYLLHRDPEVFPNPEKFDPDRFLPENSVGRNPYAYVPFSAGPRNCIGQRFAMMEMKTVISNILRRFRVESLDQRDKIIISAELILRPGCPLNIKFTPR